MKDRFQRKLNLTGLLLCVYLALFFLVIIPFHHHADNSSHNSDCVICTVTKQLVVLNISSLLQIIFVLFLIVALDNVIIQTCHRKNLHLRSPPFLNYNNLLQ